MACNNADDCAPSQVCGNDGFCASTDVAGTCGKLAAGDASVAIDSSTPPMPDAGTPDMPPNTVMLTLRLEGRGVVAIPGVGNCDSGAGGTQCDYAVTKDAVVSLTATPKNNWRFDTWEDACDGQPTSTCVIVPSDATDVRARFELVDDD